MERTAALTGWRSCCFADPVILRASQFRALLQLVGWCVLVIVVKGAEPAPIGGVIGRVLRSCEEVRGASSGLLERNPRVDLEATITFVESGANLLFIHDGTAGIYVHGNQFPAGLKAGLRVALRGMAQPGRYTPVIFAEELEPRGEGALPAAEAATVARVNAGALDCQWVELSGIVRRDGPSWLHRVLEVYDGDEPVYVRLKEFEALAVTNLLDARVQVRGVVANHFSETNRPPGFTLYVPHPEYLRVVQPPSVDPFATPLVSADRLAAWPGVERQGHLLRVRGVVTYQLPGRWLALRADETPVIVETIATNRIAQGDELEVVGFVRQTRGQARLVDAIWRPTGAPKVDVSPRILAAGTAVATTQPGDFIEVVGVLRGVTGRSAVFQCDQTLLPVMIRDGPPTQWEIGGEYRMFGTVWTGATDLSATEDSAAGRTLWVTDPGSARLIQAPVGVSDGWLTARDFLWLGVFAAAVAGWWWQHRRQRGILDDMEAALAFNRGQLVRAESEQARIARDLHDGVIQSIYAVGMRIEECRRLTDTSPQTAGEKLAGTREVLNHVIRDMRGFLTGLEPASIQGRELKTALKSVVLGMGDEAADRIALEIDRSAAESLTSKDATELFHICKEAISNSLRHGRATRVEVSLQPLDDGCCLEIVDDGIGFDPAQVSGESRGLQNLRTRAKNLRSQLQLITAPGTGTRLVLILPDA